MLFALHVEPFYNKKSDTPKFSVYFLLSLERSSNDMMMMNIYRWQTLFGFKIGDYRGDVDCNQSVRVYQTKAGSAPAWQSCLFLPQKLPQKESRFGEQESGKTDLGKRQIVIKKCHLRDTSPKISSPDSLGQVKRFQY